MLNSDFISNYIEINQKGTNKKLLCLSTSPFPTSSNNDHRNEDKNSKEYSIESLADSSNYSGKISLVICTESNIEISKLIDNKNCKFSLAHIHSA